MWPSPKIAFLLMTAHSLLVSGSPIDSEAVEGAVLGKRACPAIHVFGARETTAPAGYGTAGVVVNLILAAYPGATSEAIVYPACGGQSSCGGVAYGDSARQGTAAVASAVNSFYSQCPTTQLVLVGYSQGGQIMDDALCGGPDTNSGITTTASPISAGALGQIKALIEMGSPRYVAGLSYNVGTCAAYGFAARPSGYVCGGSQGSKIKSYCDSADPYCCTGNDANVHQGYGTEYGAAALAFVKSKLSSTSSGGTTTTTSASSSQTSSSTTGCSALYGQCGGTGWTGATCCSSGTCKYSNAWYSQCL